MVVVGTWIRLRVVVGYYQAIKKKKKKTSGVWMDRRNTGYRMGARQMGKMHAEMVVRSPSSWAEIYCLQEKPGGQTTPKHNATKLPPHFTMLILDESFLLILVLSVRDACNSKRTNKEAKKRGREEQQGLLKNNLLVMQYLRDTRYQ